MMLRDFPPSLQNCTPKSSTAFCDVFCGRSTTWRFPSISSPVLPNCHRRRCSAPLKLQASFRSFQVLGGSFGHCCSVTSRSVGVGAQNALCLWIQTYLDLQAEHLLLPSAEPPSSLHNPSAQHYSANKCFQPARKRLFIACGGLSAALTRTPTHWRQKERRRFKREFHEAFIWPSLFTVRQRQSAKPFPILNTFARCELLLFHVAPKQGGPLASSGWSWSSCLVRGL